MYVIVDSDADFLTAGRFDQCVRQLFAILSTVLVAGGSGYVTGTIMLKSSVNNTTESTLSEYDDGVWWEGNYFADTQTEHLA